jgi:hypothetical protein
MELNIKNDFDIKLISTNKLINEVENLHTIDNSAKMLINTLLEQIIKRDNLNK